jgi:hypothetical protein
MFHTQRLPFYSGVRVSDIEDLPAGHPTAQFLLALVEGAGLSQEVDFDPSEMSARLKRSWKKDKASIRPKANRLLVAAWRKKSWNTTRVVVIVKFNFSRERFGVCGTPMDLLSRLRTL